MLSKCKFIPAESAVSLTQKIVNLFIGIFVDHHNLESLLRKSILRGLPEKGEDLN